jgi:cell division septation protein DedD
MVSVLDLQHQPNALAEPAPAETAPSAEPQEFEFVLGRMQVASLLFVFSIILMICVAASYMAGKAMAPKPAPAVAVAPVAAPVLDPEPPPIVLSQEAPPPLPIFAEPKPGLVYIQMGAVEKGVSVVLAEGLRVRGLPAFVASGPNEKIFRVLIGPLPDPASYMKAKEKVDQIGLSTFARKYPN